VRRGAGANRLHLCALGGHIPIVFADRDRLARVTAERTSVPRAVHSHHYHLFSGFEFRQVAPGPSIPGKCSERSVTARMAAAKSRVRIVSAMVYDMDPQLLKGPTSSRHHRAMTRLTLLGILAGFATFGQTQLTIYNQNFAAVKERRSFDLKSGENEVRVSDLSAHLEPDSVVLRDLKQPDSIRILEQNYESDPLSEGCCSARARARSSISRSAS